MPEISQIHNVSFSEYIHGFNLGELIFWKFKTGYSMSAFMLYSVKTRDTFKNQD